jgi:predicted outer membrane protein
MNVGLVSVLVVVLPSSLAMQPALGAQPQAHDARAKPAWLAQQDLEFLRESRRLHALHEAAARLALDHSRDVRVRQYARRMLRDHSTARERLERIARGKGFPDARIDGGPAGPPP